MSFPNINVVYLHRAAFKSRSKLIPVRLLPCHCTAVNLVLPIYSCFLKKVISNEGPIQD